MATSFNKTYSVTVKYSRSDEEAITDSDMNVVVLRAKIKKAVGAVVPIQQGILDAHIVGSVTEA